MDTTGGPQHGSVAEEATRLAEAVQHWVRQRLGDSVVDGVGTAAECAACPFCAALRRVRDGRPEAVGEIAASAVALLGGVRDLLAGHTADGPSGRQPG
jgi:hypothetical protein